MKTAAYALVGIVFGLTLGYLIKSLWVALILITIGDLLIAAAYHWRRRE